MANIYHVLNSSDTQDMQTIFGAANTISGGIFAPIILFIIGIVWLLGAVFTGKPISRALLYSSFVCSIISILFVIMGWLSTNYMYFCFFLVAIGLFWTRMSESYS